jgi:hypothetical protein
MHSPAPAPRVVQMTRSQYRAHKRRHKFLSWRANGDRATARRRRQVAAGQLKPANGLAA